MKNYTIIVTGVPRSGTSMTMRMLMFGGIPLEANHIEGSGTSFNKYGCFEKGDLDLDLKKYKGKAVKTFNPVVLHAMPKFKYKVIIPIRDTEQCLKSRHAAFKNKQISDSERLRIIGALTLIKKILSERDDVEVLEIPYNDYFNKTSEVVARMAKFLDGFDAVKASSAVDHSLFKIR